jgi:hypothetical protein
MDEPTAFRGLVSLTDYTIRLVGSRIEIFGVLIIVAGMFGTPICICDGRRLGTVPSFIKSASADRFYFSLRFWSLPTWSRPLRMN